MALAPLDLLASILAMHAARGGLHALAVEDTRTRFGVAPQLLAQLAAQAVMQLLPGAVFAPSVVVVRHEAVGRQVVREIAPGTAGAQQIADGVNDLAPFIRGEASAR